MVDVQKVDERTYQTIAATMLGFLSALKYTLIRCQGPPPPKSFFVDQSDDDSKMLGPQVEGKLCTQGADSMAWSTTWLKVFEACSKGSTLVGFASIYGHDFFEPSDEPVQVKEEDRVFHIVGSMGCILRLVNHWPYWFHWFHWFPYLQTFSRSILIFIYYNYYNSCRIIVMIIESESSLNNHRL